MAINVQCVKLSNETKMNIDRLNVNKPFKYQENMLILKYKL